MDDCGPTKNGSTQRPFRLKLARVSSSYEARAHQGMKDAQVGHRERPATTERNKGTPTTPMKMQVDLGTLTAARIRWSTET